MSANKRQHFWVSPELPILIFSARTMVFVRLAPLLLLPLLIACSDGSDNQAAKPILINDPYGLPQPLISEDGTPIVTARQWHDLRRPEILQLFAEQVYGRTPDDPFQVEYVDLEEDGTALDGTATRKQVRMRFSTRIGSLVAELLLYLPNQVTEPKPVFVGLNFRGNHTVSTDPAIWLPASDPDNRFERGNRANRWPVEEIIARGYGLATLYYNDIDPDDRGDDHQNGIHRLFCLNGQSRPAPDEWGAIGAWAWGLSRVLDFLLTDSDIDPGRIAVMGHSRLGKTSLWAGARDERFALVVSNNSGTVGASLSRREGEPDVACPDPIVINACKEPLRFVSGAFPHWFADNFDQYRDNPSQIPVDQHQLIALMAPRPVYIASAEEDTWADPLGEFEGGLYASPVYELLGEEGMGVHEQPPINTPVQSIIGYHIRDGVHDVTLYDWQRYMDFADIHLGANR